MYYGTETQKALAIIGEGQSPRPLIKAYGEVKLGAIRAQQSTARIYPDDVFTSLERACTEVIDGSLDEHFPLPLAQGGAGTSLHMNICEVLAKRTNELSTNDSFQVHPLDHLAGFQSTNDTFSTAVIIMCFRLLEEIEKEVILLQESLVEREQCYQNYLMIGRTELQDALPITLGQVFGAWAGPVERDRWRMNKVKERIRTIPLGGTAIGTSFSAPTAYIFAAEKELRKITSLPLSRSQNLCDQVAHLDSLSEAVGAMGLCADNLYKMSSDLLLYTSSLSGEMKLEEQQYGSTIMADKVNPVSLELIKGLAITVSAGSDLCSKFSREGQFQLNAFLPFFTDEMIRISAKLKQALKASHSIMLPSLIPQKEVMLCNLIHSPALINTLKNLMDYTELKKLLPKIKSETFQDIEELKNFLIQESSIEAEKLANWGSIMTLTTGVSK